MRRKAIIVVAQRLTKEFGADAYEKARELERGAKRRRNSRVAVFYEAVARQIGRDAGRPNQTSRQAAKHQSRALLSPRDHELS
jgi:hypothetical protein